MGIFKTASRINSAKETKGFYFGAPEAEGENVIGFKLTDYFEDYLSILHNLQHGKFIFTGRKGVGKSAITKYIKDTSDVSTDSFATILRISDFECEKLMQNHSKLNENDILLFEWLILVNLVKLIIKNQCGTYTLEYGKLQKFLDNNSGLVSVDKFQVDETFRKSGGEVSFGGLMHVFGGVFKNYFDVKTSRAPFYKVIAPLKEIVKIMLDYPVNRNLEFWLLFDDLDINYDVNNEQDNLKLFELIRLAKLYNNEVFQNNKAKILIFLRDDIRRNLISKYPDSAKIFTTYEILISWYEHNIYSSDENSSPLKKLANRRIELNFKKHEIAPQKDAWYSLFTDENFASGYMHKTSFKYVLDFTFYRPRDIITFLALLGNESFSFPVSATNLKKILNKYIELNILEIKSELSLFFNEVEKNKVFKLFHHMVNTQGLTYSDVLNKATLLNFSMESEKVLDILIYYSFIIYQAKDGSLYFNYRENPDISKFDNSKFTLTLPKCIYHHFRKLN